VLGGGLTPTPGKWLGACLALFAWGLRQQPVGPAAEKVAPASPPVRPTHVLEARPEAPAAS
jgi:hypothetical protein